MDLEEGEEIAVEVAPRHMQPTAAPRGAIFGGQRPWKLDNNKNVPRQEWGPPQSGAGQLLGHQSRDYFRRATSSDAPRGVQSAPMRPDALPIRSPQGPPIMRRPTDGSMARPLIGSPPAGLYPQRGGPPALLGGHFGASGTGETSRARVSTKPGPFPVEPRPREPPFPGTMRPRSGDGSLAAPHMRLVSTSQGPLRTAARPPPVHPHQQQPALLLAHARDHQMPQHLQPKRPGNVQQGGVLNSFAAAPPGRGDVRQPESLATGVNMVASRMPQLPGQWQQPRRQPFPAEPDLPSVVRRTADGDQQRPMRSGGGFYDGSALSDGGHHAPLRSPPPPPPAASSAALGAGAGSTALDAFGRALRAPGPRDNEDGAAGPQVSRAHPHSPVSAVGSAAQPLPQRQQRAIARPLHTGGSTVPWRDDESLQRRGLPGGQPQQLRVERQQQQPDRGQQLSGDWRRPAGSAGLLGALGSAGTRATAGLLQPPPAAERPRMFMSAGGAAGDGFSGQQRPLPYTAGSAGYPRPTPMWQQHAAGAPPPLLPMRGPGNSGLRGDQPALRVGGRIDDAGRPSLLGARLLPSARQGVVAPPRTIQQHSESGLQQRSSDSSSSLVAPGWAAAPTRSLMMMRPPPMFQGRQQSQGLADDESSGVLPSPLPFDARYRPSILQPRGSWPGSLALSESVTGGERGAWGQPGLVSRPVGDVSVPEQFVAHSQGRLLIQRGVGMLRFPAEGAQTAPQAMLSFPHQQQTRPFSMPCGASRSFPRQVPPRPCGMGAATRLSPGGPWSTEDGSGIIQDMPGASVSRMLHAGGALLHHGLATVSVGPQLADAESESEADLDGSSTDDDGSESLSSVADSAQLHRASVDDSRVKLASDGITTLPKSMHAVLDLHFVAAPVGDGMAGAHVMPLVSQLSTAAILTEAGASVPVDVSLADAASPAAVSFSSPLPLAVTKERVTSSMATTEAASKATADALSAVEDAAAACRSALATMRTKFEAQELQLQVAAEKAAALQLAREVAAAEAAEVARKDAVPFESGHLLLAAEVQDPCHSIRDHWFEVAPISVLERPLEDSGCSQLRMQSSAMALQVVFIMLEIASCANLFPSSFASPPRNLRTGDAAIVSHLLAAAKTMHCRLAGRLRGIPPSLLPLNSVRLRQAGPKSSAVTCVPVDELHVVVVDDGCVFCKSFNTTGGVVSDFDANASSAISAADCSCAHIWVTSMDLSNSRVCLPSVFPSQQSCPAFEWTVGVDSAKCVVTATVGIGAKGLLLLQLHRAALIGQLRKRGCVWPRGMFPSHCFAGAENTTAVSSQFSFLCVNGSTNLGGLVHTSSYKNEIGRIRNKQRVEFPDETALLRVVLHLRQLNCVHASQVAVRDQTSVKFSLENRARAALANRDALAPFVATEQSDYRATDFFNCRVVFPVPPFSRLKNADTSSYILSQIPCTRKQAIASSLFGDTARDVTLVPTQSSFSSSLPIDNTTAKNGTAECVVSFLSASVSLPAGGLSEHLASAAAAREVVHRGMRAPLAALLMAKRSDKVAATRECARRFIDSYASWQRRNAAWCIGRRARIKLASHVTTSVSVGALSPGVLRWANASCRGRAGPLASSLPAVLAEHGVLPAEASVMSALSANFNDRRSLCDRASSRTRRRPVRKSGLIHLSDTVMDLEADLPSDGEFAAVAAASAVSSAVESPSSVSDQLLEGASTFSLAASNDMSVLFSRPGAAAASGGAFGLGTGGGAESAVRSEWELQQRLDQLAFRERREFVRLLMTATIPALLPVEERLGRRHGAQQWLHGDPAETASARFTTDGALPLCGRLPLGAPCRSASLTGLLPPTLTKNRLYCSDASTAIDANKLAADVVLLAPGVFQRIGCRIDPARARVSGVPWFGGCNCAVASEVQQRLVNPWSDSEKLLYCDKFLQYPKDFARISTFFSNKSTGDCIAFYYDTKHVAGFKHRLKAQSNALRRRVARNGWLMACGAARDVGVPVPSEVVRGMSSAGRMVPAASRMLDTAFSRFLRHPGPYARVDSLHRFVTIPMPLTGTITAATATEGRDSDGAPSQTEPDSKASATTTSTLADSEGTLADSKRSSKGSKRGGRGGSTTVLRRNDWISAYGLGHLSLPWGREAGAVIEKLGQAADALSCIPSVAAAAAGSGSGIGASLVRVYMAADALSASRPLAPACRAQLDVATARLQSSSAPSGAALAPTLSSAISAAAGSAKVGARGDCAGLLALCWQLQVLQLPAFADDAITAFEHVDAAGLRRQLQLLLPRPLWHPLQAQPLRDSGVQLVAAMAEAGTSSCPSLHGALAADAAQTLFSAPLVRHGAESSLGLPGLSSSGAFLPAHFPVPAATVLALARLCVGLLSSTVALATAASNFDIESGVPRTNLCLPIVTSLPGATGGGSLSPDTFTVALDSELARELVFALMVSMGGSLSAGVVAILPDDEVATGLAWRLQSAAAAAPSTFTVNCNCAPGVAADDSWAEARRISEQLLLPVSLLSAVPVSVQLQLSTYCRVLVAHMSRLAQVDHSVPFSAQGDSRSAKRMRGSDEPATKVVPFAEADTARYVACACSALFELFSRQQGGVAASFIQDAFSFLLSVSYARIRRESRGPLLASGAVSRGPLRQRATEFVSWMLPATRHVRVESSENEGQTWPHTAFKDVDAETRASRLCLRASMMSVAGAAISTMEPLLALRPTAGAAARVKGSGSVASQAGTAAKTPQFQPVPLSGTFWGSNVPTVTLRYWDPLSSQAAYVSHGDIAASNSGAELLLPGVLARTDRDAAKARQVQSGRGARTAFVPLVESAVTRLGRRQVARASADARHARADHAFLHALAGPGCALYPGEAREAAPALRVSARQCSAMSRKRRQLLVGPAGDASADVVPVRHGRSGWDSESSARSSVDSDYAASADDAAAAVHLVVESSAFAASGGFERLTDSEADTGDGSSDASDVSLDDADVGRSPARKRMSRTRPPVSAPDGDGSSQESDFPHAASSDSASSLGAEESRPAPKRARKSATDLAQQPPASDSADPAGALSSPAVAAKWDDLEKARFLWAVWLYGHDLPRIHATVPSKSLHQCRNAWQNNKGRWELQRVVSARAAALEAACLGADGSAGLSASQASEILEQQPFPRAILNRIPINPATSRLLQGMPERHRDAAPELVTTGPLLMPDPGDAPQPAAEEAAPGPGPANDAGDSVLEREADDAGDAADGGEEGGTYPTDGQDYGGSDAPAADVYASGDAYYYEQPPGVYDDGAEPNDDVGNSADGVEVEADDVYMPGAAEEEGGYEVEEEELAGEAATAGDGGEDDEYTDAYAPGDDATPYEEAGANAEPPADEDAADEASGAPREAEADADNSLLQRIVEGIVEGASLVGAGEEGAGGDSGQGEEVPLTIRLAAESHGGGMAFASYKQ